MDIFTIYEVTSTMRIVVWTYRLWYEGYIRHSDDRLDVFANFALEDRVSIRTLTACRELRVAREVGGFEELIRLPPMPEIHVCV